jgi:hypothetical protein
VKLRLLLLPLGMLLACSQSGVAPATRLSGTNSSAVSGSLLFVTSTRSNELRVLDLEPRAGLTRDYVRAPNPLAPLSIPTVPAPVELATPTRYGQLGQPLQGDWIFARGAGNPSVSIIGAVNCGQQLKEFARISPRPDSVVTAMASRLTTDDRQAQLYFTTFDGNTSTLWELILPNLPRDRTTTILDPKFCGNYPASLPPYSLQPISVWSRAVVTAMVALPTVQHPGKPPDPEERRLVIASRLLDPPLPLRPGMVEEGRIFILDPGTPGLGTDPYNLTFNPDTTVAESFPVKRLITHGNVVKNEFDPNQTRIIYQDGTIDGGVQTFIMDAGTRVFGILDEASCGGSLDCVGVMAVDLDRTQTLPLANGGSAIVYPVAIDGFDDRRDDPTQGSIEDTYWRPPNTFDDGGVRNANRMIPIRFGNNNLVGIVQDIAVQSSGLALYVTGVPFYYGLLGFVTISGTGNSYPPARIFAFDGMTLRQINFSPNVPQIIKAQAVLGNGAPATFRGGPVDFQVEQGIWPYSETTYVQYEGVVAGIGSEPLDAGLGNPKQGRWPVTINARLQIEQGFAEPGDIVVPVDVTGTECPFAFPVLDQGDGGILVQDPDGPVMVTRPEALALDLDGGSIAFNDDGSPVTLESCPPPLAYNLRSSTLARHPLTVRGFDPSGFFTGWLGRMALPPTNDESLFAVGDSTDPTFVRFWRPPLDAGTSADVLSHDGLSFKIKDVIQYGLNDFDAGIEPVLKNGDDFTLRGAGYTVQFLNGYTPASVGITSSSLGIGGLELPGALAVYQREIFPLPQNTGADRVFVLYPQGNVILDFSPTTVTFTGPANTVDIGIHY